MDLTMTLSLALIGLAAVAAGVEGVLLPPGERIAATLTLVVGAGIGVVTLAVGTQLVDESPASYERVFLVGSALGFLGTAASLLLLWRRTTRIRDAG